MTVADRAPEVAHTSSLGSVPAPWVRARLGFTAGVIAAVVMLVAIALLRIASDVVSLPEVIADGFLLVLPGAAASAIIDSLQKSAKPLLYLGVAVGTILVGGLLGRWYGSRPDWRRPATIALGCWVAFGAVLYTLVGAGPFGADLVAGPVWHGVTLLALFALYAATLHLLFHELAGRSGAIRAAGPSQARRNLLATLGGAGIVAAIGGLTWRLLPRVAGQPAASPRVTVANAAPWDVPGLSPEVTPTGDFYTVSKNFIDPSVNASGWQLKIDGMVDKSLTFSYDQLTSLPASEGYYTLMCISNEVGGDLWGNAHWKGVKLRWLLEQAGVQPGVYKAVFSAADDYKDSVKIENAMHPDALLAWEMNGAPLAQNHGFPARLLIPGIYGMKNVKWLTGITLVKDDFKGYWQTRGWDDAAPYQTASRIDVPRFRADVSPGSVDVAGVAFAGDRGIQKVEVSVDGGQTWQAAELKQGLSPYTWQLWRTNVNVRSDTRTVRVRAWDGQGHLQIRDEQPPVPSGSTGWHTVDLLVS